MRLDSRHITTIKKAVANSFGPEAKVYLFGSRVDDRKKGGDIDLYIETQAQNRLEKKIVLLQQLYAQLGEQRIDIVVNNFKEQLPIFDTAKTEGLLL